MVPSRPQEFSPPIWSDGAKSLKVVALRWMGDRPRSCVYCATTVPVGDPRCDGCGAAVTSESPMIGGDDQTKRNWIWPLLLCILFPPALLIVAPVLFWRWLRLEGRNPILPILICIVFPPAALLVAPAMMKRSRQGRTRPG